MPISARKKRGARGSQYLGPHISAWPLFHGIVILLLQEFLMAPQVHVLLSWHGGLRLMKKLSSGYSSKLASHAKNLQKCSRDFVAQSCHILKLESQASYAHLNAASPLLHNLAPVSWGKQNLTPESLPIRADRIRTPKWVRFPIEILV